MEYMTLFEKASQLRYRFIYSIERVGIMNKTMHQSHLLKTDQSACIILITHAHNAVKVLQSTSSVKTLSD